MSINALVVSRNPRCFSLNLSPYFRKIVEPSARLMQEFAVFLAGALACGWRHNIGERALFRISRDIDELQYEWPSSYNTSSSGQEVSANNILKDRRFATTLRANNDLCLMFNTLCSAGKKDGGALQFGVDQALNLSR